MNLLGLAGEGRLLLRGVFGGTTLFVAALAGGTAFAQTPCGGSVCARGLICQSESGGCPDIACTDGDCPPCGEVVEVCAPGPCTSDADCAADLRCAERRRGECSGGAPACDGPDCAATPATESCTEIVDRVCMPKWALVCAADADCGEGFRCVQRRGSCSDGSPPSGSPRSPTPMSGDGAGSREACEEEPGEMRCEAIRVACTAAVGAADPACPAGWTCRENPEGACWSDANGNTGCEPSDPPKLCFPPHADFGGSPGRAVGEDAVDASTKTGGTADGPSAQGGCAYSANDRASAWLPAALLGLAAFARRRRR